MRAQVSCSPPDADLRAPSHPGCLLEPHHLAECSCPCSPVLPETSLSKLPPPSRFQFLTQFVTTSFPWKSNFQPYLFCCFKTFTALSFLHLLSSQQTRRRECTSQEIVFQIQDRGLVVTLKENMCASALLECTTNRNIEFYAKRLDVLESGRESVRFLCPSVPRATWSLSPVSRT